MWPRRDERASVPISSWPSFSRIPDEPGDAPDVDEDARLAEPQLHQRHEAVAAGKELPARRLELGDRLVNRGSRWYVLNAVGITLLDLPGPSPVEGR